jgi:hypothetical protein
LGNESFLIFILVALSELSALVVNVFSPLRHSGH